MYVDYNMAEIALMVCAMSSLVGSVGGGIGNFFDGNISNVKIYNKVLTDSEIQQNYNVTKGRFGL